MISCKQWRPWSNEGIPADAINPRRHPGRSRRKVNACSRATSREMDCVHGQNINSCRSVCVHGWVSVCQCFLGVPGKNWIPWMWQRRHTRTVIPLSMKMKSGISGAVIGLCSLSTTHPRPHHFTRLNYVMLLIQKQIHRPFIVHIQYYSVRKQGRCMWNIITSAMLYILLRQWKYNSMMKLAFTLAKIALLDRR